MSACSSSAYLLNDIEVISLNIEDLRKRILYFLSNKKSNQIITINLDFLRIAFRDKVFKEICIKSDLVVPDGIGITKLIKLKYNKSIERITGNDLLIFLLELSEDIKLKFAFVGSSNKVLKKLEEKIKKKYSSAEVVNLISPPIQFENDYELNKQILNKLKESKPDILLVALGCPRQEKWLFKYKDEIGAKINVGVGAALDFYTGHKKRAPEIIQRLGLEWLWRLINEPFRLFNRYIIKDIPFFLKQYFEIKFNK
ncbi:MAG: WecB/TagA/CpsF family glycosyltransferase [Candidatus Lokiarchaeota archaeon]|nr:WecB/TagA/CpsF family glycosyltransferase [Candidatus Lokiarchaeota archaeon]